MATVIADDVTDVSAPETWPGPLTSIVTELDRHVPHVDHPADLAIPQDGREAVKSALLGQHLLARHFTRLMPHEFDSIRSAGLQLPSQGFFDGRLHRAEALGYISQTVAQVLKDSTIFAAESQVRGDRNFVCLTIGPVLEEDAGAVSELLGTWGGEGIFFAGDARDHAQLLRTLGEPAVVQVALPPACVSRSRFFPAIENVLLGRMRGLPGAYGDVLSREAVRPDAIVAIRRL